MQNESGLLGAVPLNEHPCPAYVEMRQQTEALVGLPLK